MERTREKWTWKKRLLVILILVVDFALFLSVFINSKLNLAGRFTTTYASYGVDEKSLMQDDDIKNILLIGEDQRSWDKEGDSRSDSMILCSINKKTNMITVCSLMRDLYVEIPEHGNNRLNTAYQYGGTNLLDRTIEYNFGVKIDGNVVVDFEGFLTALTEVGDLDITLTQEEADFLNETKNRGLIGDDNEVWNLKAGTNTMKPNQVLAYARDRWTGNADWSRTERQRKVIEAAYHKLWNSSLSTIMRVANNVLPCISTDLTNKEILGMIYTVATSNMKLNTDGNLPATGTFSEQTVSGMQVIVPDTEANKKYLQELLYGESIA